MKARRKAENGLDIVLIAVWVAFVAIVLFH